jgi:hypothetical protein
MEALSSETSALKELARETATPEPFGHDDARQAAPAVFAFDGWGLVPLELHPA